MARHHRISPESLAAIELGDALEAAGWVTLDEATEIHGQGYVGNFTHNGDVQAMVRALGHPELVRTERTQLMRGYVEPITWIPEWLVLFSLGYNPTLPPEFHSLGRALLERFLKDPTKQEAIRGANRLGGHDAVRGLMRPMFQEERAAQEAKGQIVPRVLVEILDRAEGRG